MTATRDGIWPLRYADSSAPAPVATTAIRANPRAGANFLTPTPLPSNERNCEAESDLEQFAWRFGEYFEPRLGHSKCLSNDVSKIFFNPIAEH